MKKESICIHLNANNIFEFNHDLPSGDNYCHPKGDNHDCCCFTHSNKKSAIIIVVVLLRKTKEA